MIVVLFNAVVRKQAEGAEYDQTDARLFDIVSSMPGFVSFKEYSADDGETIGVVRFESREALEAWRDHPEHVAAQKRGREHFYASYEIEVLEQVRRSVFQRPPD
jgi:heme-degrading monooxygenase HmoA